MLVRSRSKRVSKSELSVVVNNNSPTHSGDKNKKVPEDLAMEIEQSASQSEVEGEESLILIVALEN